jgi:MazG family protein
MSRMHDSQDGSGRRFEAFVDLIARLRAPGGCPWDREQTHHSLKPMTLEEAYEVIEAIDHAQIAREESRFDVGDVIDVVTQKMVRRHPHVFGDETASTPDEVLRNWETLKQAERRAKGQDGAPAASMLDSVSERLPAAMEAYQLATKVSRVGFDWPDAPAVLDKLREETEELHAELRREPRDLRRVQDEIGDLLFTAVSLARLAGCDPESALKAANLKFRRRFRAVEERLRSDGREPQDAAPGELDRLWDDVKRAEK